MDSTDDSTWLREYGENHSDEAFALLVNRHVNLVYSVALRHVCDPHQAEEITQSVFILLANKAEQLRHAKALSSWLFQATRLTACNFVRSENRRRHREQEAHMQSLLDDSGTNLWQQIGPLLDDAVADLSETDRQAIVLRFYERRNLREVGAALGASEDAAEKRVSRAIEKLRMFFAKHGVTVGASSLAVVLTANAVQAAPVGLAVTISTAAALGGTTLAATATATATKVIAMTTLQKIIVTATVAVLAGAGIYEARQAAKMREQNQSLRQEQAAQAKEIEQLLRRHDDATNQLALLAYRSAASSNTPTELLRLRGEVARFRTESRDPTAVAASDLMTKVERLKQRLRENPDAKIPELELLAEKDWLKVASGKLETEIDYRRALSELRRAGERMFEGVLRPALSKYMQANNGQFPTDLAQLRPYSSSQVDDSIWQRWNIVPTKTTGIEAKTLGDWVITQKAPVDDVFDLRLLIGPKGGGSAIFMNEEKRDWKMMTPLFKAYSAANDGKQPKDLAQLRPYATTPEQKTALENFILRRSASE